MKRPFKLVPFAAKRWLLVFRLGQRAGRTGAEALAAELRRRRYEPWYTDIVRLEKFDKDGKVIEEGAPTVQPAVDPARALATEKSQPRSLEV